MKGAGPDAPAPAASLQGERAAASPLERSPIQRYLEGLHARYAGLRDGQVATYIPELAKVDPDKFAICIATTDGRVYEVGDSRHCFTIQSISKPLTYGLALSDHGLDEVLRRIGVEPTGDAFNSISLEPGTGRPLNPMINAGAIAAASMVSGHSAQDKAARLLAVYSMYAGRPLEIDQEVFESERSTGHRNRAIGHMLRNFDILDDPEPALDLYFRQCSIAVDCRDLGLMAATLANGGVHPVTGERVLEAVHVERVLSVMTTCGLYDAAGEWVFRVGMPAKSGVGGGILVVLPGQLGIGVFSPRLDAHGNSVRGLEVCKDLSRDLDLHFLRSARPSRSVFRAQYSIAEVNSKRRRPEAERALIRQAGHAVRVYELQGDLLFPAIEAVVSAVVERGDALATAVLDFKRVTAVGGPAARILFDLIAALHERGQQVVLASCDAHGRLLRTLGEQRLLHGVAWRLVCLPDLDGAIEWCENGLLSRGARPGQPEVVPLADNDLCRDLDAAAIEVLEPLLALERYAPGQYIVSHGEPAQALYLIVSGQVKVALPSVTSAPKRLSTLSAGLSFGELAMINGGRRSADVIAVTAVECRVLDADAFARLGASHPAIEIALLKNMLRSAHEIVNRLSQEVTALAG
ncbi:MAG: glutaminase A [Burkholderiaceae bacterium]